jgi:hypothetical protein
MSEVTGKLVRVDPVTNVRRNHQPGPGAFQITTYRGQPVLTYPCPDGTLTGYGATHFDADDGRIWAVEWIGTEGGVTMFLLPENFNG